MPFFRQLSHAIAAGVLGAFVAAATAAQPSAEQFTRWPAIEGVQISPSGQRLALLQHAPNGMRSVAVMDLAPLGKLRLAATFSDVDIHAAHWVNDDRLVFWGAARGGPVVRYTSSGLWAVDHDGARLRRLVSADPSRSDTAEVHRSLRVLPPDWRLQETIDDGSDEILVSRVVRDGVGNVTDVQLSRLNSVTGERRGLSEGLPAHARTWLLDAAGEVRFVTTLRAGQLRIHRRAPGAVAWESMAQFDWLQEPHWMPWFLGSDGTALVTGRLKRDTSAIFRLDPAARKPDDAQPVLAVEGFDLEPEPVVDSRTRQLLGAQVRADGPLTVWFDAKMGALQRGIDAALPERRNTLICGRCETSRFVVVRSESDRLPAEFLLFDREKLSLQAIGASRPWIDAGTQGRRTLHRVAMRDGLNIPVYVTHPPGSRDDEPLPTVVLVHSGPWMRGSDLRWDAQAQFLATRGWRVLQPEFRGSDGYGDRLFRAGFKQWGGGMQNDLVDTLQWAGAKKFSAVQRACVMGTDYGGYAALMAPIVHPGVFRCAVAFGPVTDIGLMYELSHSALSLDARGYEMPQLLGDPKLDAELLRRSSPLQRAAELKLPVLLGLGGDAYKVPRLHALRFASAAKAADVPVEVVDYPTEGGGFYEPKNQADWWQRVERFLATHLAAPR